MFAPRHKAGIARRKRLSYWYVQFQWCVACYDLLQLTKLSGLSCGPKPAQPASDKPPGAACVPAPGFGLFRRRSALSMRSYDEAGAKPWYARWKAYVLVLLGLVAVALVGKWFAGAGAQKNAKAGRPAAAVAVARVDGRHAGDRQRDRHGHADRSATVRTQLSGTVFAMPFKEGQMVHEGQVIAQIDPRPYKLSLSQAQGTLAKDLAQLASARLDLKRYETLAAQDSVARQTLDTQRATVGQLEGTVAADRAAVGTAQLNLQYTAVKAPFSGRIGLRQVSVGPMSPRPTPAALP
jgi:biotin carboxyl carrier protein